MALEESDIISGIANDAHVRLLLGKATKYTQDSVLLHEISVADYFFTVVTATYILRMVRSHLHNGSHFGGPSPL